MSKLRQLIREEVKKVLEDNNPNIFPRDPELFDEMNEDLGTFSQVALAFTPIIGSILGGIAGWYLGNSGISLNPIKIWNEIKTDRKVAKIVKRLSQDKEVLDMSKRSPSKGGWRDMLKKKLTPEEQKYLYHITRTKFPHQSKWNLKDLD